MNIFQQTVISLIISALGEDRGDLVIPADLAWQELLRLGYAHQIMPLLYYGLMNVGAVIPEDVVSRMRQSVVTNVVIDEKQIHEISQIAAAFSEAKIDFSLLKGSVLKQLYPHSEMRMMGDADILVRANQYAKIRPVMLVLGFIESSETSHVYLWEKKGVLLIELHKQLIHDSHGDFCLHYKDSWALMKSTAANPYRYEMDVEENFVFLLTHFAKHYRIAGVGLRHFIDLWVYLRQYPEMDQGRIKTITQTMGLYDFYLNILKTMGVWFKGGLSDEITDCISNRIFQSGSFGNVTEMFIAKSIRHAHSKQEFGKAKLRYLRQMLFPSYEQMRLFYPSLKRMPVLLPVLWLHRIFVFSLKRRKNIAQHTMRLKSLSEDNIESHLDELELVGLKLLNTCDAKFKP